MKNKKNLIRHLVSLAVLLAGFVISRYVFFDVHGMKEWPRILFICGVVVLGVSFFVKARLLPLFTALSYIGGFVVGVIFHTHNIDPVVGGTSNLWIIWTAVFACSIFSGIITDLIAALIAARKRKIP